jgi:hypothetical protein
MDLFKRQERAERIRAYKRFFESDDGRLILNDLKRSCHFYTTTMDGNPQELAYKEGERSVVLRILRTISTDPAELEKILNEQDNRKE